MRHLGNMALLGVFAALLTIPLISFGFLEYAAPTTNVEVLPASTVRSAIPYEEAIEVSEATEATP